MTTEAPHDHPSTTLVHRPHGGISGYRLVSDRATRALVHAFPMAELSRVASTGSLATNNLVISTVNIKPINYSSVKEEGIDFDATYDVPLDEITLFGTIPGSLRLHGLATHYMRAFTNVTAFRASLGQAIYEREYTKTILNTMIGAVKRPMSTFISGISGVAPRRWAVARAASASSTAK